MTGSQRAEIEDRLDLDEPPQVLRRRRLAIGKRAPGKARWTARKDRAGRIGGHVEGHHEIVELELSELDARQCERERAERSPQTGIGRECADEGVGAAQVACDLSNLRIGEEQQAVAFEKGAAARLAYRKKALRMSAQRPDKLCRCLIGQLRGRSIDHDDDLLLGKILEQLRAALRPGDVRRNQVLDVGLERKMAHGIDRRSAGQDQRNQENRHGTPRAERHERDDGRPHHGVTRSSRSRLRNDCRPLTQKDEPGPAPATEREGYRLEPMTHRRGRPHDLRGARAAQGMEHA